MPKNKILTFKNKKNNLGFSFIPLLFLIISILIVGLFSYNFFQNKIDLSVLQSDVKFRELNFSFNYFGENVDIIEMRVSGDATNQFINRLPKQNRLSLTKVDGKKEIIDISFFKTLDGEYMTRFNVTPDTVKVTFLDINILTSDKMTVVKIMADKIAPWKYNPQTKSFEREIVGKTFLDVSMRFTGKTPNTGVLTFIFTESPGIPANDSLFNQIRQKGIVVGSYCVGKSCLKDTTEKGLRPIISKTKTGFTFTVNVDNLTRYIYMPLQNNNNFVIKNLPQGWIKNSNNDGIDFDSVDTTYIGFDTPNNSSVRFSVSGHSTQYFELLKDITMRGVDVVSCSGDSCSISTVIPVLRTGNKYTYTFIIPVNAKTSDINFKSNQSWSRGFDWEPYSNNNKFWQVNKNRMGIERFSKVSPKVTVIESNFNNSISYYFYIEGYAKEFDTFVLDLKKGIKGEILYYPKANSCNNFAYGTCQFQIITSRDDKFFNFDTKVKLDFIKIPDGWKVNAEGNGIYK